MIQRNVPVTRQLYADAMEQADQITFSEQTPEMDWNTVQVAYRFQKHFLEMLQHAANDVL